MFTAEILLNKPLIIQNNNSSRLYPCFKKPFNYLHIAYMTELHALIIKSPFAHNKKQTGRNRLEIHILTATH
jgi:hypothetical protein